MSPKQKGRGLWDKKIVQDALVESIKKLNPKTMLKNPVMFVVEVGSLLTTYFAVKNVGQQGFGFTLAVSIWLWFTVVFANFAEAMAEGRGKAQAETLRKTKTETKAKLVVGDQTKEIAAPELKKVMLYWLQPGMSFPETERLLKG